MEAVGRCEGMWGQEGCEVWGQRRRCGDSVEGVGTGGV